jgi:O-antigen/teichoic acid export membrane protein
MKSKLEKLQKKPFVRNVLIMATGTAAAQAVTMALSPIITRLYGPEAFGLLGVFTAVMGIIVPIAALTYPVAIVLPKRDEEAKGLVRLSLYISIIIALIVTVILIIFYEPIVSIFNIENIAPFLYLLPLVIIFSCILQVIQQWLIRKKQFGINAKATFLQSLVINGSKVGIGLLSPIAAVLVVLQVAANGLSALIMMIFSKKSGFDLSLVGKGEKVPLKNLAKKYIDFPSYRAPEEFLSALSQGFPILLLTTFFGPAAAGFYNIGQTVLNLPSRLLGQSVGDVFYPRITEAAQKNEDVSKLIKKATVALSAIGIVPFGVVIIFGPWLFEFVFGSEWVVAGEYARWIALASFTTFINKPSVRSMPVLSAQRFLLFFTITRLFFRVIALVAGFIIFKSDVIAIALLGIISAVLNILLIFVTLSISKKLNYANKL